MSARHPIIGLMLAVLTGWIVLAPPAALAGPIADYEGVFRNAYADYRDALFATNAGNPAASVKATDAFVQKWSALTGRYRNSPPPHFAEDPKWPESLDAATAIVAQAKGEIASGDLGKAHGTLESIRDLFAELRERNGVLVYSDRIDAFHEVMEKVVTHDYRGFTGASLTEFVEDVGVLSYLARQLGKAPPDVVASPDFAPTLAAVTDVVAALQMATRQGDIDKIKAVRVRVKPAYAKLFVKFG